jgi:hypothetical protein
VDRQQWFVIAITRANRGLSVRTVIANVLMLSASLIVLFFAAVTMWL